MKVEYIAVITAIIGVFGSYIGSKINTKPSLEEANVKSAKELYDEYKMLNSDLKAKVECLEREVASMRLKYETELQELRVENKILIEENTSLKILLGGKK